jgi:hypothetical protein
MDEAQLGNSVTAIREIVSSLISGTDILEKLSSSSFHLFVQAMLSSSFCFSGGFLSFITKRKFFRAGEALAAFFEKLVLINGT